jgi:hypothetical protein
MTLDRNFELSSMSREAVIAVESRDHAKNNGVSPKDQMSRGNVNTLYVMTKEEIQATINKADSGDLDAMKKAAQIFIEIANLNTDAGKLEISLECMKRSDEYIKRIKTLDPTW